jgi:WD40 repeat protein
MDDDSESKDLTKPGSKSLSRAEKRTQELERFLGDLSFQAAAGHTEAVNSLCFSPDGSQVASGSHDGTVVIWETASGRALHRLEHGGGVRSVVFNRDGSQVASGSDDGTMKMWNPRIGRLLATFLAFGRNDWITYTRDGYFIGSDEALKRVMMKWEHDGNQYPPDFFPRDNPNPQKVAEALAFGRSKKPKPRTHPRRPPGFSGRHQKLLSSGSNSKYR